MSGGLEKKWYEREGLRLLLAIALNLAFLAVMLCCFEVRYEENDDLTVQKFLDGQTAVKTPFVIYINYFLALLVKVMYDGCGNSLPMFSILQYGLLMISFTGVSYLLFKRVNALAALAGSMAVLCFIGADSYLSMTYTKTAGIATVGGISLMLLGAEEKSGIKRWLPLILGAAVAVLSFMLRDKEFLACVALMLPLGLWWLVAALRQSEKSLGAAGRLMLPFAAAAALVLGLYGANEYIWDNSEYAQYKAYNQARGQFVDYNVPEYEQMQDVYDSLGITETDLKLRNWYDTEKWTKDTFDTLNAARAELVEGLSWGESLGVFLNYCLGAFFQQRHIFTLTAVALLWLCSGRRDRLSFGAVLLSMAVFGAMYLMLIHQGRYLVNRTDVGFFFALTVTMLWMLDGERARGEQICCTLLVLLCLGLGYRQNRDYCYYYGENILGDDSQAKAAVEAVIEDGHLFLAEVDGLNLTLYSPLETVPAGYGDKIVLLGDWVVEHPKTTATLAQYGVENPYRDMVDNEQVYLISADIELSLRYIQENYYPNARAEAVEPLSTQTGLGIYRITEE